MRNINHPLCGCTVYVIQKNHLSIYNEVVQAEIINGKVILMANKSNSLAHTKWMCKYHIVFIPKYRRKAIYGVYKESIREILIQLCRYKGVEILEGHLMPDHVHMLVSIPPKISVSQFMGYLKGKSALMIFDKHANLKYKYGNRHFWCRGYYVDTVGKNAKKIEEYVKNQMQEDLEYDQMSLKEYIDPFTGEPVNKA